MRARRSKDHHQQQHEQQQQEVADDDIDAGADEMEEVISISEIPNTGGLVRSDDQTPLSAAFERVMATPSALSAPLPMSIIVHLLLPLLAQTPCVHNF